jgi:hypothetical protein
MLTIKSLLFLSKFIELFFVLPNTCLCVCVCFGTVQFNNQFEFHEMNHAIVKSVRNN